MITIENPYWNEKSDRRLGEINKDFGNYLKKLFRETKPKKVEFVFKISRGGIFYKEEFYAVDKKVSGMYPFLIKAGTTLKYPDCFSIDSDYKSETYLPWNSEDELGQYYFLVAGREVKDIILHDLQGGSNKMLAHALDRLEEV